MCEYFDIISSSLFIAIAHFWDPVNKKRECEGTKLTIFLYISISPCYFWCMQQNNVCFLVCQVGFSYPTILRILTTRSIIIYSRFMSTTMHTMYRTILDILKPHLLCNRRACSCLKQHLQILDKKKILQLLVEEKQDGRDITLISVFVKDDKAIKEHDFTIYHLPKSQHNFLTEFNERRTNIVGDLRMLSNMVQF